MLQVLKPRRGQSSVLVGLARSEDEARRHYELIEASTTRILGKAGNLWE